MATNIFNYNGTKLTTVPDGRIDTTSASIKFPGYGYLNYGEAVNENMLWIMQNFAAPMAPSQPVIGQTWFDTSVNVLKVYDGAVWAEVGTVLQQSTEPAAPSSPGVLWYDTVRDQLRVWSGNGWLLVGPLGSGNNSDPLNPQIPENSALEAMRISDGVTGRPAWRLTIAGSVLAIFSKDAEYTPIPSLPGFSTIKPGVNFNSTIALAGINGDQGIFRRNQDNIPITDDLYSLGNDSYRFSSVHAVNFVGKATAAANADAAAAATSALIAENSNRLGNVEASSYLRSDLDALPITNNTQDLGSSARQWRTLYASNVLINGSPVFGGISNILGTANQVNVAGSGNVTLSLPQSIATTSSPRFASIGLNAAAGAAGSVTFGDGTVQTTAAGSAQAYNLNVLAPLANINLAVGNKLALSFTNFTNIPLYTACAEGVYRVILVVTSTDSQNVDLQWYPNSTTTPISVGDSFETTGILTNTTSGSFSTTAAAQNTTKSGAFWFDTVIGPNPNTVASRGPFIAEFVASTYTVAKMIKASTSIALGVSINNSMWLNGAGSGSGSARLNTTTPWTSLGVIRLEPVASVGTQMSGLVTVERIA